VDLEASINAAYAAAGKIHFAGMHYRRDIGARGLRRYNEFDRARSSVG
jgi:phosphoribosylamine-glycine ligase